MGILDSVLKVFVGDKSKKDLKDIQPKVELIKKAEKLIEGLQDDQLRAKTAEFKEKINEARKSVLDKISELTIAADATDNIDKRF